MVSVPLAISSLLASVTLDLSQYALDIVKGLASECADPSVQVTSAAPDAPFTVFVSFLLKREWTTAFWLKGGFCQTGKLKCNPGNPIMKGENPFPQMFSDCGVPQQPLLPEYI